MPLKLAPDISAEEAIKRRAESLSRWLEETAPDSLGHQAHLDAGTSERAYWHYGYLVALRDVLALLQGKKDALH